MSRLTSVVDERGFDEETGKTISASTCPVCSGEIRADGGQIDCLACGAILNDYARTGRLPDDLHANRAGHTLEETA